MSEGPTDILVRSSSNSFKINVIIACIVSLLLSAFTVLLNTIAALTIKRYPSLKKKTSYYLLYLQSLIDLLVGLVSMPIYTYFMTRIKPANNSCP